MRKWLHHNLIWVAFFVAVAGLASPFIVARVAGPDATQRGIMGDWLGGTSAPLLGLAGFMLVLAAFFSQQEELELTRREFRTQNRTLRRQRFEQTFFQRLDLLNNVVQSLRIERTTPVNVGAMILAESGTGRATFRILADEFLARRTNLAHTQGFDEATASAWDTFFNNNEAQLGHYFRVLYHTVRFVDKSNLPYAVRKDHVDLIRAQLSSYELFLLFHNCLVGHGADKFAPLVRRYGMLKHLRAMPSIGEDQRRELGGAAYCDTADELPLN